jgi:phenazine biosynthesis protein PhzF family
MGWIGIRQVDAFTEVPFGGNPAGVVTVADSLDEGQMQLVAREMNLSETAFVAPSDKADFKVRFFTPNSEVDLCGHATIGSFAALHEEGRLDSARTVFTQETKAGVLEVERSLRDGVPVFTMTQAKPRFRGHRGNPGRGRPAPAGGRFRAPGRAAQCRFDGPVVVRGGAQATGDGAVPVPRSSGNPRIQRALRPDRRGFPSASKPSIPVPTCTCGPLPPSWPSTRTPSAGPGTAARGPTSVPTGWWISRTRSTW